MASKHGKDSSTGSTTSAHANLGLVEHISFLIEELDEMVRRQDECTGREALADDTRRPIMMDMCPAKL